MKQSYVYIPIAAEDKVLVCTLDSENGAIELKSGITVLGGPEILAIDPAKRFLFVECHPRYYPKNVPPSDSKIYSYRIDWETGDLNPINAVSLKFAPVHASVDRKSKFLLSAYYKSGKVSVHRINEEGEIGEATQWLDTGGGAHSIRTDPSNKFAFLPHVTLDQVNKDSWPPVLSQNHILQSASNTILQFKFDDDKGILIPNSPFKLPGERGGGPRHYCFHPKLNVVYFSNEQGCSVTAYSLNTSEGNLTPFQIISTIPEGYDKYTNCSSLRITRSGRFLFVLNRGHDSVACFAVDSVNGRLKLNHIVPTEVRPRELDLDPEDKFLFVVGLELGRLASYRVLDDGKLKQLESRYIGKSPRWVLVTRQDS
ncbi:lactonase family protein [Chloroflexota bacterium]